MRSPTTNPWSGPIWAVKNRAGAHDVLQALNDLAESDVSVEKTSSENLRPIDFSIDTPGLTDGDTFQNLRDELDNPWSRH